MKKLKTMIASAVIAVSATAVVAEGLDIAVGQQGRGYERRGIEIAKQLQDGWAVRNFAGSEDIARAVCNDPTTPIGIAQIDAIRAMEMEGCQLRTVGVYPSLEYAVILFPPDSPYNELSDMASGNRVLVDKVGSGTALFWQTIVGIEKSDQGNKSSWSEVSPVYDNIVFAESMADVGDIDAVILVGNPNSTEVWELINAGWEMGELYDKDINDLVFRKGPLYDVESITIDPPGAWNSATDDAYVVKSYFIVNPTNLDDATVTRLARIVKAIQ